MTLDKALGARRLNRWALAGAVAVLIAQGGIFAEARAGRIAAQDAADAANASLLSPVQCVPASYQLP